MGNNGLITKIKQWIAGIGFKLFLWGNSYKEEEYWEQIYWQEYYHKNPTPEEDGE